jgi:hypothetical protein
VHVHLKVVNWLTSSILLTHRPSTEKKKLNLSSAMQESLELNQEERYNRQVYAVSNGFLSGGFH